MKAKDTATATTIRSVLAEVYSADKASADQKISSSAIVALLRKASARRVDSATQFIQASRPDLADKEKQEADLLAQFLPPLLSEAEVDRILKQIIEEQFPQSPKDPRKAIGMVFKAFYAQVDRSAVDPDMVKRRADHLAFV
ncbi:GatB/YqeY domain-containing protein [Amylostereum chailletii]|nr:GatB/YqeY domain-containing protein [Amylostereum chailletii]